MVNLENLKKAVGNGSMVSAPTVSVSIITYNHERYIAKAIESVLSQRTDFRFEIIIGDDCSSDGTRGILRDYQKRYPDLIQLILHPKRYEGVPGRLNNITNIYACRGTYVALLDGDDFWLSDRKLQTQVDFLQKNPSLAAIANRAIMVSESGDFTGGYYGENNGVPDQDHVLDQRDVLKAGWCLTQTSSLMFRNKMFTEFPNWFWDIVSADFGLILLLSEYGNIKYLKEPFTAYRIHEESFTTKFSLTKEVMKLKVHELRLLRKLFLPYGRNLNLIKNVRNSFALNRRISMFKHGYAHSLKEEGNFRAAVSYLTKASLTDFSLFFFLRKAFHKFGKSLVAIQGR